MLELGLIDSKMSRYPQSLQAISALYIATKYLRRVSQIKSFYTLNLNDLGEHNYTMDNVRLCAKEFNKLKNIMLKKF